MPPRPQPPLPSPFPPGAVTSSGALGQYPASPQAVRTRRAQQPPQAQKSPLAWLSIAALAVLLILAIFAGAAWQAQQEQLNSLRRERAEAAKKHEDQIGYYVSMRRQAGVYDTIKRYADQYQVHPSFISAIIARESHYDPYAESRVGARGLMQVMEDSGTWIAGKLNMRDYTYQNLFDPDVNINFGTWYLAYLSSHFNGDPLMIAAAYHAGPNNVKQWAMKYGQDEKKLSLNQIPKEDTRNYVQKVMNAYALYYEYDRGRH